MKKLLAFCLIIAMFCMAFVGCGQGPTYFSMFDIIGANRTSALLDHYDSIHVIYHWNGVESGYYIDSEIGYYYDEDIQEIYLDDVCFGSVGGFFYRTLFAGMEVDNSWLEYLVFDEYGYYVENIVRYEVKDGLFYVNTNIKVDDLEEFGYFVEDWERGGFYRNRYILDEKTFSLISMEQTFVSANSVEGATNTVTMEYNTERPAKIQTLLKREAMRDDLRTLTLILDPNTAEESVYTLQTAKGDYFDIYVTEEYQNLYLDRDCTKFYEYDENTYADLTLYGKKGK